MISAQELVDGIPPRTLESIRRGRRGPGPREALRATAWCLLGIAAVIWLAGEAADHGHTFALVVGLLPVILGTIWLVRRRPGARQRPRWTGRRVVGSAVLFAIEAALAYATYLLVEEGLLAGIGLVVAIQLPAMSCFGPIGPLLSGLRAARLTRRRVRDLGPEGELDELAWTAANSGGADRGSAPLTEWIARLPVELAPQLEVVPMERGSERERRTSRISREDLAPGLRRTFPDGRTLTAQPEMGTMGGELLVTLPDGSGLEVSGARRALKGHGWRGHGDTVAAAELVIGPTILIHARSLKRDRSLGDRQSSVLLGGSTVSVPVGSIADRGVRVSPIRAFGRLQEPSAHLGVEVLVPARTAGDPVEFGNELATLADAVQASVRDVTRSVDVSFGRIAALRLSRERDVVITQLPVVGAPRTANMRSLLVWCPDLGLVIDLFGTRDEHGTAAGIVSALVRGGAPPAAG